MSASCMETNNINDCPKCQGKGYILMKGPHWNGFQRVPCLECEATGLKKRMWHSKRFLELKILSPEMERDNDERRAKIDDKIDDLQEEIEDKENEIEGLEEEIDCIKIQIDRLRSQR
jgi:hypothetical protein